MAKRNTAAEVRKEGSQACAAPAYNSDLQSSESAGLLHSSTIPSRATMPSSFHMGGRDLYSQTQ